MTWDLSPNGRVLIGFSGPTADDLIARVARKLGFQWTQVLKSEARFLDPATAHEIGANRWIGGLGLGSGVEFTEDEIAQLLWSPDGAALISKDRSTQTATLWDIPPRKSLTWFAAGAALLALPIALVAWRRTRKLRAA